MTRRENNGKKNKIKNRVAVAPSLCCSGQRAGTAQQSSQAACAASSLFFSLQQQQVDWARRITNSRRHSVSPFLFSILLSILIPLPIHIVNPLAIQSAHAISRNRVRSLVCIIRPSPSLCGSFSLCLSPSVSSTLFTALNFPLF